MGREADVKIMEGAQLNEFTRLIDRLARELSCLNELGASSAEEAEALSAVIEDLWCLLFRIRRSEGPEAPARRRNPKRAIQDGQDAHR